MRAEMEKAVVPVPVPRFEGRAAVKIDEGFTVAAEKGRIVFQLRGHSFSLTERTDFFDLMMVAFICDLLLEKGVDIFELLEKELGAPGLFSRTKLFVLTMAFTFSRDVNRTRMEEQFLSAIQGLREAAKKREAAFRRAVMALETVFPLPIPSIDEEAVVGLSVKTPWRTPEVLRLLFGEREVRKLVVEVRRCHLKINDSIILSATETRLYDLIIAASLWNHFAQQGTDVLALLETALQKPGLFDDLRTVFKLVLSTIDEMGEEA